MKSIRSQCLSSRMISFGDVILKIGMLQDRSLRGLPREAMRPQKWASDSLVYKLSSPDALNDIWSTLPGIQGLLISLLFFSLRCIVIAAIGRRLR